MIITPIFAIFHTHQNIQFASTCIPILIDAAQHSPPNRIRVATERAISRHGHTSGILCLGVCRSQISRLFKLSSDSLGANTAIKTPMDAYMRKSC